MEIKKIHSVTWGNVDHTGVVLIADTDTGDNQTIGTTYGPESIIWDTLKTFPVDQIAPYVEPVIEEVNTLQPTPILPT